MSDLGDGSRPGPQPGDAPLRGAKAHRRCERRPGFTMHLGRDALGRDPLGRDAVSPATGVRR